MFSEAGERAGIDKVRMAFQQGTFAGGEGFPEFSVRDLHEATGGFHHMCVIGEGGFGKVYRAMVNCTPVAIKVRSGVKMTGLGALLWVATSLAQ